MKNGKCIKCESDDFVLIINTDEDFAIVPDQIRAHQYPCHVADQ
jgi:hypothetical protein